MARDSAHVREADVEAELRSAYERLVDVGTNEIRKREHDVIVVGHEVERSIDA